MRNKSIILFVLSLFLIQSCNSGEVEKTEALKEHAQSEIDKTVYLNKGNEIAKATFQTLSSTLKAKMKEGGVPTAIDYCNLAAYPLTDSIAKANNVILRRVSDSYRNPANKASEKEEKIIEDYRVQIENKDKVLPQLVEERGEIQYYGPILTQELCLKCHGEPGSTLSDEDYNFIKEKYPDDLAIHFEEGDLRGIWSITFLEE